MGYERRNNPSLGFTDRDAFVTHMLRDQPPRPANMVNIVAINQGKRAYTEGRPAVPPLDAEELERLLDGGHAAIDIRAHESYAAGHVPGTVNVQISSASFEQNLGWILSDDRPFVLVGDAPADAPIAAHKLAFVGLDRRAAGFVRFADWSTGGRPVAVLSQIDVGRLSRELGEGRLRVLDVRERSEWESGHIPTSVHTNFKHLPQLGDELPVRPDEPVAVVCAGGARSVTACGLLRERGYREVHNVRGGVQAWAAAGLRLVLP